MSDDHPIPVPADLGPAGRALLRKISEFLTEQVLILDPHEAVVLIEGCRIADRIEQIRAALVDADVRQPQTIRMLSEERQQRAALSLLLLTRLGLPTGVATVSGTGSTPRSRRGQAGAANRWGKRA